MIIAYLTRQKLDPLEITSENVELLKEAVWIDLISPSRAEEAQVEHVLNLNLPTREEMAEIELSSRLYKENGILFMTVAVIAHSDSPEPKLDPVTFVLTAQQLVTIRYIEPQSFVLLVNRLRKFDIPPDAEHVFLELLDVSVDRLADILELVGHNIDESSKTIFRRANMRSNVKLDYQVLMHKIGTNGDLNTKASESLMTFSRLIRFFGKKSGANIDDDKKLQLSTLSKDITSLSDHAVFLSTKINFLLDAILGLVSIEQNNIIKIFSVAAVIFLPPTLIASIYGMNFHFMPELSWKYGYLLAIGCILVAAWLPYKYFKYRKWL